MIDRCYIDRETGFLIPGCYGACHGGARYCRCEPTPPGVAAMAKRDRAEDRKREAEEAARAAEEARRWEAKAEGAAAWRAAGGVPRVLPGGRA